MTNPVPSISSQPLAKNLTVASLNAEGMAYNLFYISELMENCKIICLQEHWYFQSQIPDIRQQIEWDFHARGADYNNPLPPKGWVRGYGGVLTAWHPSLNPYMHRKPDGNERVIVCSLEPKDCKPICLINAYLPSGKTKKIRQEFCKTLDMLEEIVLRYQISHSVCIAADLNHDLFNRRDPDRKRVIRLLQSTGLLILSDGAKPTMTSICQRFKSHIDVYMSDSPDVCGLNGLAEVTEKAPENTSPHTAVLMNLNICIPKTSSTPSKHTKPGNAAHSKPRWDEIDIDMYNSLVEEALSDIDPSLISPETAIEIVENTLKSASDSLTKGHKEKLQHGKKRRKPWTKDIAMAVEKSKRTHAVWKSLGKPGKSHPVSIKKRKASRAVRTAQRVRVAAGRRRFYGDVNRSCKGDNRMFHRLIKMKKRSTQPQVTLVINGQPIHDPVKAAEAYKDYFSELTTPAQHPTFQDSLECMAVADIAAMTETLDTAPRDLPIDMLTMSEAVQSLNNGKAADNSGLTAEHLKWAGPTTLQHLCSIFRNIRDRKAVPSSFKLGKKIPIPKKDKDPSNPNNSRGIVINSQLGKVQESLIKHSCPIPSQQSHLQFGFTEKICPEMAALCATELLSEATDSGTTLFIASLDAQKAFDVVVHPILIQKLVVDGTPRDVVQTILDLYSDGKERVLWNGVLSDEYQVKQGVKQGGILSTGLYKLYVDGLLHCLKAKHLGACIGDAYLGVVAAADDILLMAHKREDLQAMLYEAALYASRHRYVLHPVKSITAVFNPKKQLDRSPFQLHDQPVTQAQKFTHLGLTRDLSRRGSYMTECIADRVSLAQRTAYSLMPVGLHGGHGLNPVTSLQIISTHVTPRMLYGLESCVLNKGEIDMLETYYRSLLKDIQSLPSCTANEAVYLLLGTLPITAELHKRVFGLAGAIARLPPQHPLRVTAVRQLSIKDPNSKSWFSRAKSLAEEYDIPLQDQFISPLPAVRWKKMVDRRISRTWYGRLVQGAAVKSTLSLMKIPPLRDHHLTPHELWSSAGTDPRRMTATAIRAKLLAGSYILQASLGRQNQHSLDATCQLCGQGDEDRIHFLLRCRSLSDIRDKGLQCIAAKLQKLVIPVPKSDEEWCALILNGLQNSRYCSGGVYGCGSCMPEACSSCMSDACRGCMSGSGDSVVSTTVIACCPRSGDTVVPTAGVSCSPGLVGPGLDNLIKCSHSELGSCSVKLDGHICPSHGGSLVGSSGPEVGCTGHMLDFDDKHVTRLVEELNHSCSIICLKLHEGRAYRLKTRNHKSDGLGAPNTEGGYPKQ